MQIVIALIGLIGLGVLIAFLGLALLSFISYDISSKDKWRDTE